MPIPSHPVNPVRSFKNNTASRMVTTGVNYKIGNTMYAGAILKVKNNTS